MATTTKHMINVKHDIHCGFSSHQPKLLGEMISNMVSKYGCLGGHTFKPRYLHPHLLIKFLFVLCPIIVCSPHASMACNSNSTTKEKSIKDINQQPAGRTELINDRTFRRRNGPINKYRQLDTSKQLIKIQHKPTIRQTNN